MAFQIINAKDQIAEDRSMKAYSRLRLAWHPSNELNMYAETQPLLTPRDVASVDVFLRTDEN